MRTPSVLADHPRVIACDSRFQHDSTSARCATKKGGGIQKCTSALPNSLRPRACARPHTQTHTHTHALTLAAHAHAHAHANTRLCVHMRKHAIMRTRAKHVRPLTRTHAHDSRSQQKEPAHNRTHGKPMGPFEM
eukprot:1082221-Alexandrium_andersonii.AAC.1